MSPFRTGLALGLLAAAVLITALSARAVRAKQRSMAKGWNEQPALVFATDLAQGATVKLDDLSQRPLPEQFLSGSAVSLADAPLIAGRKIGLPVLAGDVVRWAHFTAPTPPELLRACGHDVLPKVEQATAAARERSLAELQKNMGAVPPAAAVPPADGPGDGEVLVAKEDIPEGSALSAGALARRRMGGGFVTPSNIPAKDLDRIAGARVLVPVQQGDPILWQTLDTPDHPRSRASCIRQVTEAIAKERKRVIEAEAEAFVRAQEAKP
ncbi:MAG TPA: SAF domain-containing protein [Myxococcaceae bacterium]|nr:SAF domain-containing protein [Myxococcaceae bacterium]